MDPVDPFYRYCSLVLRDTLIFEIDQKEPCYGQKSYHHMWA